MKIKPLKPKQNPQAARIFWVLFPFLGFWLLWKFFRLAQRKHRFYGVQAKGRSGKLLGLMAFTSLFFLKRKWFYLQYLAIDQKQQGKGLGGQVLQKAEAKARGKKHDFFFLLSPPWRTGAQRFYFRQGFKRLLWFIFWKRLK